MGEHAKYSPSAAARWMKCPDSIGFCEKVSSVFPEETSIFAEEGKMAHELAEAKLRAIAPPAGKPSAVMVAHVNDYVDFCRSLESGVSSSLIEERVTLKNYGLEDCWGTADFIYATPFGHLDVVDLKYGVKEVFPEDNPQLKIYAIGALDRLKDHEVESVRLHIFQPRAGGLKTWETGVDNILGFVDEIKSALKKTGTKTGDHCKWCSAKPICPKMLVALGEVGSPLILKDSSALGENLKRAKLCQEWAKSIEALALSESQAGNVPQGFKLVRGRSTRKWGDESEVIEEFKNLGEGLYEKKILSPAKLEKVLSREEIAPFVSPTVGKLQLAHMSDKRSAVDEFNADNVFGK